MSLSRKGDKMAIVIIGYIIVFLIGIKIGFEIHATMVDMILDKEIEKLRKEKDESD